MTYRLVKSLQVALCVAATMAGITPRAAYAGSSCLSYEPAVVTIKGKLTAKVFYGPPNYGEEPATDSRETAYLLKLTTSICVSGDPSSDVNSESEQGVRVVQLGPGGTVTWKALSHLVGRNVEVSGTLFHAVTGHHRTEVVMNVSRVK